jgi:outer membrane lipoprotein SlyB
MNTMSRRKEAVAALFAGLALTAMQAGAARMASLAAIGASLPANLGVVATLETIREDRPFHQLRVKLDNGEWRTIVQERLNDVRIGDRVTLDDGQVYRHDTRAERIDRWGYWVDAKGNRYDDIGLRVDEGE